jgi:flagellar basal body P-ring formation protein FlgA
MKHRRLVSLVLLVMIAMLVVAVRAVGAQQTRRLAVATHALARGAVLSADDFEFRDSTMRAPLDSSRVAPGWTTRRMIAAGEILRSPAVEPPIVVGANQLVELEWADQNVRLTIRGIAARNASVGERVAVRTELGRRVEGTVVAAGHVRID